MVKINASPQKPVKVDDLVTAAERIGEGVKDLVSPAPAAPEQKEATVSTPATPATSSSSTSLASKIESDIVSVGEKIKAGIEAAGNDAVKLAAWVQQNASEITSLAGLAGSGPATVASVGLNLFNLVANAVKDAGTAAGSSGLSVSFDASVIADVKAVIAAIEKI